MGHDDRARGLLGFELELLGQHHADPLDLEEVDELLLVLEVRTRGVAPRVPRAAVLLAEESRERRSVFGGESPLLADTPVPQLGEGFGHLDREAVAEQVLLVPVLGEQLLLTRGGIGADGRDVERGVVCVTGFDRSEEVRDAEESVLLLAREVEPAAFGATVVVGPDDQVIALGVDGEVAVGNGGDEPPEGLGAVEFGPQRRPYPVLELVVLLATLGPELPLVPEQRGLVDVAGDLVQ